MSASAGLIACHDCDLLHRRVLLPPRGTARCTRCGSRLYRDLRGGTERALALSLASIVLLVVANSFPFLTFKMGGLIEQNHLASGVVELFQQGYWEIASLVFFAIVLAPALRLGLLVFVTASLRFGWRPPGLGPALKLAGRLQQWAMLDVFLLGSLVAIIKLSDLASVALGTSMYAFGALIVLLASANAAFDSHEAWHALESEP